MTDFPAERVRSSVLAVLRAAKDAGLPPVTRTALVKFVYLLDWLHAEQHAGETASGSRWYFDKFGPFAADLMGRIDSLVRVGTIQSRDGSGGDEEFTLYWLGEFPQGPSLVDVGLSVARASRLEQWVRKFSRDLSKLLDFVYFHTDPMRESRGQIPARKRVELFTCHAAPSCANGLQKGGNVRLPQGSPMLGLLRVTCAQTAEYFAATQDGAEFGRDEHPADVGVPSAS